jgi:phage tail-like protein
MLLTNFNFEVVLTLDNPPQGVRNPLCDGAFSECDGLETSTEPESFNEGGNNLYQHYRPKTVKNGRLTLRRGMTKNRQLWLWFRMTEEQGSGERENRFYAQGEITMYQADGSEAMRFILTNCQPIRLRWPALNAQNATVAIEEMQLAYEQLRVKIPGESVGNGLLNAELRVSGGPGLT